MFYSVLGASATFAQAQYAPVVIGGNSQDQGNVGRGLLNVVNTFKQISTALYSSLFIVALILFFVGIFQYLLPGGDAAKKKEGVKYMGFGILALFVMVGIWGIIGFLSQNTGIGVGGDIPTPGVPTQVRVY
jgi:hypothetical protein